MPLRGGGHTVSFHGSCPPSRVWAVTTPVGSYPSGLFPPSAGGAPAAPAGSPGTGPSGQEGSARPRGGKALGCGALTGEGTSEVKAGRPSV